MCVITPSQSFDTLQHLGKERKRFVMTRPAFEQALELGYVLESFPMLVGFLVVVAVLPQLTLGSFFPLKSHLPA